MTKFSNSQRNAFIKGAEKFQINLSDSQVDLFEIYAALLINWGRKINLTAILDMDKIIAYHFLDSLALVSQLPISVGTTLVDVGSGAGFPGVICALIRPELRVTLVEKVHKKTVFLSELKRQLGLDYVIVADQIENLSEKFNLVVSRATFPPDQWIQIGTKLLTEPEGMLFAMLGMKDYQVILPDHFMEQVDMIYPIGEGYHRIKAWKKV